MKDFWVAKPQEEYEFKAEIEMKDPIRLFIGSSANGEDALIEAIYEYTLRKNTKRELDIVWMRQTMDPKSHWHGFTTYNWPTPFSGYRWAIPEYCDFKGRAIYTDVDMINFRDIGDLWDVDLKGKPFAARTGKRFGGHEFCVMVIDCEEAGKQLVPVERQRHMDTYHQRCIHSFSGNPDMVTDLDPRWNCLDGENLKIDEMYQLHWTNMATQPWKPAWFTGKPMEHPRKDLVELLWKLEDEAIAAGYRPKDYLVNHPPIKYDIIGR